MTPSEVEKRIVKMQASISQKKAKISNINSEILKIKDEIRDTADLCPHKRVIKTHSSSGAYWTQSIKCEDCKQVVAQGQHLFHPSEADKCFSRGN